MLIGLLGLIGSGKDTLADWLVEHHQFVKISFAEALKDIVSIVFGWDRQLLEGGTEESRKWRNKVDLFWAMRLKMPRFTPRLALQLIGTDVMRHHFHSDIWVFHLERKLLQIAEQNPGKHIIVTDCRFENEVQLLKRYNGTIIRIERDMPVWWNDVMNYPRLDLLEWMKAHYHDVHETEWKVARIQVDHVFQNKGTKEELFRQFISLNHQ